MCYHNYMKKLIKIIFASLLGVVACASCDFSNWFAKKEEINDYHVFEMIGSIDTTECPEYFGINNEKTKAFSSKEEVDAFAELINNAEQNINDSPTSAGTFTRSQMFSFDVNYENENVYVTAFYRGHVNADYCVGEIYKKGNTLYQSIDVDINIPAIAPSSVGFVYVVASKGLEVDTHVTVHENYNHAVVYKPVIYLYNNQPLDVEVKYLQDYRLKTTYPEYEDGWRVHINENGMLNINDSQREYYAIFFDEFRTHDATFEYGFNVSKDNAREFLENSLDTLGFTNREADEFIMFWLPILEENENSLVYFEQTEERNEECPLSFSVTPDTVLRTIIHIKKVDTPQDITPQELETINRVGFTVVEWGGTAY